MIYNQEQAWQSRLHTARTIGRFCVRIYTVAKLNKLLMTLSLACNWSIDTFDIRTSFLHAPLQETLYAWAPTSSTGKVEPRGSYAKQPTDSGQRQGLGNSTLGVQ